MKPGKILKEIFLIVITALMAVPILWALLLSVKTHNEIATDPFSLPDPPQWGNYIRAFKTMGFFSLFKNTAFISFFSITVGMFCVILGAFAITRMWFGTGKLQNAFYNYFLLGLLVPTFILLFPIYVIISKMGLLDTHWGVIIPYWGWTAPMNMMIVVAAFKGIPRELDEAAAIDGCGSFRILTRVDLPIMKSALVTCLIICILGCWNEYPLSSIILMSPKNWTVAFALSMFDGYFTTDFAGKAAAIIILAVPQMIVFSFFQSQIQEGVVAGSVKG